MHTGARELHAAGIDDPRLRTAYTRCRTLNARHGRTYFLAAGLLPPAKRPAIHALYGFARFADDLVDQGETSSPLDALDELERSALERRTSMPAGDPALVSLALRDTIDRYGIDVALVRAFFASMRMDLTFTGYATYADLDAYMYGSAAVIGLQVLPVLGHPGAAHGEIAPFAADLGRAFQLTNVIRDVGDDLRRGRLYLPQEDLDAHGVERDRLEGGILDPPVRALVAHEIERARGLYRQAAPGIAMLDPTARDCVRTAFTLYREILDAVERAGYDVLHQRATVPVRRRLAVALPALVRTKRQR